MVVKIFVHLVGEKNPNRVNRDWDNRFEYVFIEFKAKNDYICTPKIDLYR